MNLLIEHQCPQCGAPAVLKETDRVVWCEYCRVTSYLLQADFFRYMLPHSVPEDRELLFVPYWRFKGMIFSCLSDKIHHRFADISHQALGTPLFPVSLGLRSQAMKLRFVSPGTPGRFLKPAVSVKKVMRIFENRFNASFPDPPFHQAFIGETLSLIYAPFYVTDKICDGVLNRAISSAEIPPDFHPSDFQGGPPDWRTRFVPTLCPNCGWNLEGQPDALALTCQNCNSVWQSGKKGLKPLSFGQLSDDSIRDPAICLPFWKIRANISGVPLDSCADMIRLANLPKVVQEDEEALRFHFWIPGFKVRPQAFLNLARGVTLSQPRGELLPGLPDVPCCPVNLPPSEALQSMRITLASFMKPRRVLLPSLQDMKITPERVLLVFVPFAGRPHEYVHPGFQVSVNKKMLELSGNL